MHPRLGPRAAPTSFAALAALGVLAGVALAGCSSQDPAEQDRPAQQPSPTRTSTPEEPVDDTDDLVARAVSDLAGRLGMEESAVEVGDVEEVQWRDGSLGCALPDTSYTMATVPGTRITLRVDGTAYSYHAATGRAPFLCETPTQ